MRVQLSGVALLVGAALLLPAAAQAEPIKLVIGKLLEITGPLSKTAPSQHELVCRNEPFSAWA